MPVITSIDNFLPADIINNIDSEIQESGWGYGWRSNSSMGYSHWNIDFGKVINENGLDISTNLPKSLVDAWHHIQQTHFPLHRLIRCYANAHTFGVEGYPHTDSVRDGELTAVVYLNREWKREWGGETIIYGDDSILHAELPKHNKALVFSGNMLHVSRGVTRICPELRISVMFKICPNDCTDATRDKIQEFLKGLGTDKLLHTSNNLCGHLLRTYDILKNAGQPADICMAGAAHSIFGTNAFKHAAISLDEKDAVSSVIGHRATYLAEMFSKISRPHALETALSLNIKMVNLNTGGAIELPEEDIRALSIIEAANLHDQKGLFKFKNLNNLWQTLTIQQVDV